MKAWDIFKRALQTVTLISLLFWIFSYSGTGNVADSLLYKVGTAIEPVTRVFGLGWRTFMGFLSSAFAKEAVLGVLNAVFVGEVLCWMQLSAPHSVWRPTMPCLVRL